MEVVRNIHKQDKKIVNYLDDLKNSPTKWKDRGRVLFLVDHGLGDFLCACEIIDDVYKDFREMTFDIGFNFNRGFQILHTDTLPLRNFNNKYNPDNFNYIALGNYDYYDESFFEKEGFDYVFVLTMPFQGDPNMQRIANALCFNEGKLNIPEPYWKKIAAQFRIGREYTGKSKTFTKQELTAILEFGIKPPIETKWKLPNNQYGLDARNSTVEINPNIIGLHWSSNSSKEARGLTNEQAEVVWKYLEELGWYPFDLTMDFSGVRKDQTSIFPIPDWIPRDRSLRFYKDDLGKLINRITACKYFIGTDSGPMHLATRLLGPDKCFIIERISPVSNVIPEITNIFKLGSKADNLQGVKQCLNKFLDKPSDGWIPYKEWR